VQAWDLFKPLLTSALAIEMENHYLGLSATLAIEMENHYLENIDQRKNTTGD
jgi:hypothetical protein